MESRRMGWTLVKIDARSFGNNSIGKDGLTTIVCAVVPDIITGSMSGITHTV